MIGDYEFATLASSQIERDPRNPRGKVTDTTDLSISVDEVGLIHLPLVRPHPTEPERYILVDGERRYVGLVRSGVKQIPCLIRHDIDEDVALDLMLSSDIKKKHPLLVLDKDGEIVAGRAYAVAQRLERSDKNKMELAAVSDIPADSISACSYLMNAPVSVKRKVASGDMKLTVYSRIKLQPDWVQEKIVSKRGKVSRSYVDQKLREHKAGLWDVEIESEDEGEVRQRSPLEEMMSAEEPTKCGSETIVDAWRTLKTVSYSADLSAQARHAAVEMIARLQELLGESS